LIRVRRCLCVLPSSGAGKKTEALKALDAIVPKRASGQVKEYAARMRADLEA